MTAYSKIYEYLNSVTDHRATILRDCSGVWFINGGWNLNGWRSRYTGFPNALKTLIATHVPNSDDVERIWLWIHKGNMKLGYRPVGGHPCTIDLKACDFEGNLA